GRLCLAGSRKSEAWGHSVNCAPLLTAANDAFSASRRDAAMGGYMLGQRLLHRLGHVVSLMDDDLQSITPLRTADPLGGNPVGLRDPLLNLSPVLVFVLRHFEPPTSSASSPGDRAHSAEAAAMFAHNATSCMHSAWPTSGRRSP